MAPWVDVAIIVGTVLAAVAFITMSLRNLRGDLDGSVQALRGDVNRIAQDWGIRVDHLGQRLDNVAAVTQLSTLAMSVLLPSVRLREDAQANRQTLDTLVPELVAALTTTITRERVWENPLEAHELGRLEDDRRRLVG